MARALAGENTALVKLISMRSPYCLLICCNQGETGARSCSSGNLGATLGSISTQPMM